MGIGNTITLLGGPKERSSHCYRSYRSLFRELDCNFLCIFSDLVVESSDYFEEIEDSGRPCSSIDYSNPKEANFYCFEPLHRNQYYSRSRANGPIRFGSLGSPPSRDFTEINCRTFQAAAGILPTPLNACATPITKRASSFSSPKTPSPSVNSHSDETKYLKRTVRSSAIPIPLGTHDDSNRERSLTDELSYSERWAGPAYSNSPPPSSLPIPKFSLRPKRTVSLDLPVSAPSIIFHPIAKSAPPSPKREHYPSPRDLFHTADSATKNLRRILNLDISDE
ncbi:hypothetical protein F0562_002530 [Nyssa sinensis]|uniref:Uncharacterized protein n=1 Tax=Nyssa sinensis TaxID=561372 RepID=A0A5J5C775_9ASTE|nr:hypothetical protein F0562_002530 [Nyssa sinensis]